jgi:rare lipoprotein A (peptidoglycan hydrolase)
LNIRSASLASFVVVYFFSFSVAVGQLRDTRAPAKKHTSSVREREVYAAWYVVPANSLARKRASKDEFTAAHDHLPLGTLVRVTHIENNKSVVVRITDRGITNRRAKIDICKEAAEQIGIVRKGIARVRLEILPDTPPSALDLDHAIAH